VLYLGEINDSQHAAWCRVIEAFDEARERTRPLALFPADRELPAHAAGVGVQVRLEALELHRPRQWGACWLACQLYEQLGLHDFWAERLEDSREGTRWRLVLQTLVCYRLIDPGSEWRLHRHWFGQSAPGDLLGEDYGLVEKNALYRCLDRVLAHKPAFFSHLKQRWQDLFGARFEVLLYDLTSTYFESDPPFEETDKRRHGYSRDHRADCVQVVLALVVTPEGFPLAYEVLAGNTADKTTLRAFLDKITAQYGQAERIWVMDRGIPTKEVLAELREGPMPVFYLVGTPKGRLTKLEAAPLERPWQQVRPGVEVKLLPQDQELYVLARSQARQSKERSMRRRQLKALWKRLGQLQQMKLTAPELLLKLGEAKGRYRAAWRLVEVQGPDPAKPGLATFEFRLNRAKLRQVRQREGRYLLHGATCAVGTRLNCGSFMCSWSRSRRRSKPSKPTCACGRFSTSWSTALRAHIFVAFMADCLQVTLRARLRPLAAGLTPRAVLEKFATLQMLDVHLPTTDGRTLILSRYTQPEADHQLLLEQLKLQLPPQPPPRLSSSGKLLP
jgi:Transposase DDE domain